VLIKIELLIDVECWFCGQAVGFWLVALGSLSFRKSRCMCDNCEVCAWGDQHASYVFFLSAVPLR